MTRKSKQLRGMIGLALALVLLTCTMATTAFAAEFSDVAQGAWYQECARIRSGPPADRFQPKEKRIGIVAFGTGEDLSADHPDDGDA